MKFVSVDPELERKQAQTHSGMAHWAGTGPQGKTCRECKHWQLVQGMGSYYGENGIHGGSLKPRLCFKYMALTDTTGDFVPHHAAACRHFEESAKPPPIRERGNSQ
jgi:hypothetical protein